MDYLEEIYLYINIIFPEIYTLLQELSILITILIVISILTFILKYVTSNGRRL